MEEDRLYDFLMILYVYDKDRLKQFKEICDYEIKNLYVLFIIDKNGGFVLYRIFWYMYICFVITLNQKFNFFRILKINVIVKVCLV